jgi:hypothetical protein
MPRPLVYSTEQRRQQYSTIVNAGLSRADYTSAIRRLNQQETKYRAAQKVRERKQKEQDKRIKAEQLARALAEAKSRAEKEKKAKVDKNKRRRERNAEKKRQAEAARLDRLKNIFIGEIEDNMKNRIGATYSFNEARRYGLAPKDVIKVIAQFAGAEPWIFSLDNGTRTISNSGYFRNQPGKYYTLNDSNAKGLYDKIVRDLIVETATTESDGMVFLEIQRAENIDVVPVEPTNTNRRRNARFFKYHNKTDIDVSRYGIWKETIPSNYDDTCLVVALRNGGLSTSKLETIKLMIKNRSVPICDMPKICDAAQIQIHIKTDDVKNNHRRVFGKHYDEVYHIGCLIEHYFIIEPTEYTSYSIKHYNELKTLPNFNQIYGFVKTTPVRNTAKYIDSYDLIKFMLQDVNTFFTEITMEDKFIASTQFYDKVSEEIRLFAKIFIPKKPKRSKSVERPAKNITQKAAKPETEVKPQPVEYQIKYKQCIGKVKYEKQSFVPSIQQETVFVEKVIQIPVVNKENYTMYLEMFNGFLWFHTDVRDWSSSIKKNFLQDLDMLQGLLEYPVFAISKETNTKLIKFGESIGFKYQNHFLGKDNYMYVVYSRSK